MLKNNYTTSFENLLRLAEELPFPKFENEREVHWCEASHTIGFSRQIGGNIELFLCGEELRASSPLVRRYLRFDQWTRTTGDVFKANRLVLPAEEHFTAATAFLAEELFRKGVIASLQNGFSQTEPLLEMILRRTALSEDELLGLIGELRFLEVLLSVASNSTQRALAVNAWRGHEQASRDFVFGNAAVEVKSTRGDRSVHHINSPMQVDPRRSESSEPLEQLDLLSLGFKPSPKTDGNVIGITLPSQVEVILKWLGCNPASTERSELQSLFLSKLSCYGSDAGHGYIHDEMQTWSQYQSSWQHGFIRVYDMNDEAVQILRRSDIKRRSHVVFDSVRFSVELPERISGELNPQNDLFTLAKKLVK
ncbi:MAG: PD-(D/E)XK motif protein [Rhodoferax sp.]|uniref:PD-(D/E)XK motif protein n=1 Tax=Rhodoferax sp. TaxID=50421 RepID=UPI0017A51D80|nr:PD-(D/E)XK motif protein [Rhodoferax sp.]NMM12963.1 PD-(D/E)XK motif protein [Rhodoferax sp.]